MSYDKSVGFNPSHGSMRAADAIGGAIGAAKGSEAVPSGSLPQRGSAGNPIKGPDVEVSAPRTGVSVANSSGEDSYMDNATGERIGLSEKLRRSGSAAPTSKEYNSNAGSLAHMAKGGNRFSAVKEQSLVPDQGGPSTPIGNTSMGSTTSNVVAAGQKAVAEHGNYEQMKAVGRAAIASKMPISPALQSGITDANDPAKNPVRKSRLADPSDLSK